MKRSAIVLLILFFSFQTYAQHKVEGTIAGYLHEKLVLLEYFGDKHTFCDSTRTDGNGWFSFSLAEGAPSGLYSLAIGKRPLFNFIFNQDDVTLKFDPGKSNVPEFIYSAENLIYYDYLARMDQYAQKSGLLLDILQYYPSRDTFYTYTALHFQRLQASLRIYTDRILSEYPGTLAAHIVRSDRPVMVLADTDWSNYLAFNRAHYLDGTDFTDTLLINTNVFTAKAIDYLGFYTVGGQNKELQEESFIRAVDTILHRAMDNGRVYDFLMQYLIEGFEMYGFDRVITHIAETYEPAGACVNEDRKSELQKRMENLRRLAPGKLAPDITFNEGQGTAMKLSDLDSDLVVVLFWASWCPHCNAMIPELKALYEEPANNGFELVAISLDTSATDYGSALAAFGTRWINHADLRGWDSKPAVDYSIYATPTMFLLDRDRKILARPASVRELRYEIEKVRGR